MKTFSRICYRFLYFWVRLIYRKYTVDGVENLPDEPCIVAGNHSQTHGPLSCEFYFPDDKGIWAASEMFELKKVPAYAFKDFWSDKPKWTHWFFKILSYLIAPLAVLLFNNAHTIPVYRGQKIVNTMKTTVARMEEGANIVVFPEHDEPYNHILQGFQEGFVDVARLYCRRSGKGVCFVPMYVCPTLRKLYILKPIAFDPTAPIQEERKRICAYLMEAISEKADSLPLHATFGYRKSLNTYNRPLEEKTNEEAGR